MISRAHWEMSEDGTPVTLYIYDLSKGLAPAISPFLIDEEKNGTNTSGSAENNMNSSSETEDSRNVKSCEVVEGIWHTSIVIYGKEHFFGSDGISICDPGGTVLGEPQRTVDLGVTYIPRAVFDDYLEGLRSSTFKGDQYKLLKHNCNNFSNELSQFLVGQKIPQYILDLPEHILAKLSGSGFGQQLNGILSNLSASIQPTNGRREDSPDYVQLTSAIEEARRTSHVLEEKRNELNEKLARREKKKNKKKRKESKRACSVISNGHSSSGEIFSEVSRYREEQSRMSEPVEVIPSAENGGNHVTSQEVDDLEAEERREREERKKMRDPPVVFRDLLDIRVEFDALVGLIDGKLSPEEMQSLEELHQYMLEDEGSWALGDSFLTFIDRLLHDKTLSEEVAIKTLNVLACAALKDDVILLLHQDRKEHILMNYANEVDRLPLEQQKGLALFMCNLFENISSSEWMLYISEWQLGTTQISNIRVTTKVAVNSLLSDNADLKDRGSAIVHNLACKEVKTVVFDDVAVELTMAILQFFNSSPPEEHLFRCMKALTRFCQISSQDVPQLIQMIGPNPSTFKGKSERIDNCIAEISKKLR
ncbi:uncharacterized protein LOC111051004 isoform X3 [Nilaparvata lugens]|uniref:uncharacterized protein LOC111051004 isoform X3 n=3 Tax=Nilaparvata lugens TaxID=108931 RepID=UPI00193D1DE6|nr:uncharacterized protein LOC111051004 isoform X3 [Nilaparvata lugens]